MRKNNYSLSLSGFREKAAAFGVELVGTSRPAASLFNPKKPNENKLNSVGKKWGQGERKPPNINYNRLNFQKAGERNTHELSPIH